jgi:outer membrane immunogenic protein
MNRHLKLAFAAGILVGLGATGVASAADMAVKARPVVAPVVYPWTGCYIGGNVGGAWSKMDTTQVGQDGIGPTFANYGRENDSGFVGGGQAGCDFQTSNLVFGVGASFDFGNVNGKHAIPDIPGFTETNSLKAIYTATGRIGYLWTPTLLGYGKGGMAWVTNRNSVFLPSGALFESSGSFTMPGMDVGVGLEWMFAPNWSVFAEYNYIFFEDDHAQHFTTTPGQAITGETILTRQRVQTALVGVNYKFHWDSPVVAKY